MTRLALLGSVAILTAVPAVAQMTETGSAMGMSTRGLTGTQQIDDMLRASDIEDANIYAIDRDYSDDEWNIDMFDTVDSNWNEIGEVEDIVFSQDFKTVGLVVSAGGFLDIGDRNVVLSLNDVRRIATDDGDDMGFVVRMTEEQLESLPEVEESWW